ncbi:Fe-S-containing hydro-lyase [Clostridioides mangenotii]|uniref:Fe-S-containing hydro-lyase n=1 Tax=Metaclostridioides mangenotii TaxID=1540 RepID=UPI001C0FCBBD|nr:Fe-S-containing hydro-lyase [Clostridioides mangenotii]MBU5307221.1 Fe-S-containing hydro-lyase [Clostridioides mangenotii]MCR1955323.1 Fe-S-containing hydro-lyase [Clostridioides mangenotii]
MINLNMPVTREDIEKLNCGDTVSITGTLYTARDAAHKKLIECINSNVDLPFDVDGQGIYYVGPTPAKPGEIIGAAGPTTSYRMDDLTVPLLKKGLRVMIGKGKRNQTVIDGMKNYGAVYLAAIGGAGAYISNSIKECEIIAYEELGAEAIRKIEVKNLQLIVAIDSRGNNIYEIGRKQFEIN